MQVILQILHYFKTAFVLCNFVLCLTLLWRRLIETRRGSLMLLFAGLTILGVNTLITNYFLTPGLVLQDRERAHVYLDLSHLVMFSAIIMCEIGLGCELIALFRRRPSQEYDRC